MDWIFQQAKLNVTKQPQNSKILKRILELKFYNTIVYYDPYSLNCLSELLLEQHITFLVLKGLSKYYLRRYLNANLLVVACLPHLYRKDAIATLAAHLNHMRQVDVLFEVAVEAGASSKALTWQILSYCFTLQMLNVGLVYSNRMNTLQFFTFNAFPVLHVISRQFNETTDFFPFKLADMQGSEIRTQPDLIEPKTIYYKDKSGKYQLIGYVWYLIQTYAQQHNATLKLVETMKPGTTISKPTLLDYASKDKLDIAASIMPMSLKNIESFRQFSYPIDCENWCTVLPMESMLPLSQMYRHTMTLEVLLFILLASLLLICLPKLSNCLRRIAQRLRHKLPCCVIAMLCFKVLLQHNYQGRLISLFIAPLHHKPLTTFDDLHQSKLPIITTRSEYDMFEFTTRVKYSSVFRLVTTATLIGLRNSLNQSYGYSSHSAMWRTYGMQQSYSKQPLFRYSTDLCYYQTIPAAFIINENSMHRATFDQFVLKITESGIYEHLLDVSFYDMVKAGRLNIQDRTVPQQAQPFRSTDFATVLYAYAYGIVISLALFAIEMFIYKVNNWLDQL